MTITTVFVHKGDTTYLKYAVAQAASHGYKIFVIGDEAVRLGIDFAATGATYVDIEKLSKRANTFPEVYIHKSSNPYDYELFCYQRWYILMEFAEQYEDIFLYLDSDILLYEGVNEDSIRDALRSAKFGNGAWTNYIRGKAMLSDFLAYLDELYRSPQRLAVLASRYAHNGQDHVSDMTVLRDYCYEAPRQCMDMWNWGSTVGFDRNIQEEEGIVMLDGLKKVFFQGNIPFVTPLIGGHRRMYTLHLQGFAKPLMQIYNVIREDLLHTVPDLTDRVTAMAVYGDRVAHISKVFHAAMAQSRGQ